MNNNDSTLGIAPLVALPLGLLVAGGAGYGVYWGAKQLGLTKEAIEKTLSGVGRSLAAGGPFIAGAVATRYISKYALSAKHRPYGWGLTAALAGWGTYRFFMPGETQEDKAIKYQKKYLVEAQGPQGLLLPETVSGKMARGFEATPAIKYLAASNLYELTVTVYNRDIVPKTFTIKILGCVVANQRPIGDVVMVSGAKMATANPVIAPGGRLELADRVKKNRIDALPKNFKMKAFFYAPHDQIRPFYVSSPFGLLTAVKTGKKAIGTTISPLDIL